MVFSDTSTKQGLVQDTSFLLFGESSDHTADYPLADVVRNINNWYDKVVTKILEADGGWIWDDTNLSATQPDTAQNIVSGTNKYAIAGTTYLKIHHIEAKDSAGNPIHLTQITLDDITDTVAKLETSGVPKYVRLTGDWAFLYPTPNYNATSGFRAFYQRNVNKFVAADTTKVPGFAENFHRILSYGAALDYAIVNGMTDKSKLFRQEIEILFADLQTFYGTRNDTKHRLSTGKDDYGELGLSGGSSTSNSFNIF